MRDRAKEVRDLFNQLYVPGIIFEEFPEQVWLLQDAQRRVYKVKQEIKRPDGSVEWDVWGIVCFSKEFISNLFIQALDRTDLAPAELSFAEARELAQTKTVSCLFLLDNPENIIVHWVK